VAGSVVGTDALVDEVTTRLVAQPARVGACLAVRVVVGMFLAGRVVAGDAPIDEVLAILSLEIARTRTLVAVGDNLASIRVDVRLADRDRERQQQDYHRALEHLVLLESNNEIQPRSKAAEPDSTP
jgi:hypothetical protein